MAAPKTYRAKNEVHITETPGKPGDKAKGIAPTAPKVAVIPAGGLFTIDPDSDTCKELLSGGVIALAEDKSSDQPQKVATKKAPTKKAPAKKAPAKKAAPAAGDGDGGDDDDLV